jgi:tetratricopeptide (TPR) repeat protein
MSAGFRNQHREALAWADRALAIDDTSPHAWSARALCQKDLGALDDAAASARRAIELDDAHSYAHYLLACVEARRGASADAVLGPLARAFERWPEGRGEAAEEPDLAPVRELPAFRALVGAA